MTPSICELAIDWGSAPEWLGAIGSVSGVLFVYIGLRREIRRQRAEQVHAKAAQARLIYATTDRHGDDVVKVVVENASNGPAFDVRIAPMSWSGGRWEAVTPVPQISDDGRDQRINSGEVDEFYVRGWPAARDERIGVELVFTDQDGARWRRLPKQLPEPQLLDQARPSGRLWRRAR